MILINSAHCWTSALQKKMMSFAYKRCEMEGHALAIFNPDIRPSSFARQSCEISASVRIMRRNGDRGSPCLRPRDGVIFPFGSPFKSTWSEIEEIQIHIQSTHFSANDFPSARIFSNLNNRLFLPSCLLKFFRREA